MILKFLSAFDLFRQPFVFFYNGDPKRSSTLGLFSSIIVYFYIFFSFFFSDLYNKENPIVITQNIQINHGNKMHFDQTKLFAITLMDYNVKPIMIDPTIFYIEAYTTVATNATPFIKPVPVRHCTLNDTLGNQTLFNAYHLQFFSCLSDFYLEGGPTDWPMSVLTINLRTCRNGTKNVICRSPEEIAAFFDPNNAKYFSILYENDQIDVVNYDNPFKPTYQSEYVLVDSKIRKKILINMKSVSVNTDSGWILPNIESKTSFFYSSQSSDFGMYTGEQQPLALFQFYSTKDEITLSRRYQTIAEFLGGCAGVVKIISIFFGVFVNIFLYISTLQFILNKMYSFPAAGLTAPRKKTKGDDAGHLIAIRTELAQLDSPQNRDFDQKKREFVAESPGIPLETHKEPTEIFSPHIKPKDLENEEFVLEHFSTQKVPPAERVTENDPVKHLGICQRLKSKCLGCFGACKGTAKAEGDDKLQVSLWEYLCLMLEFLRCRKSPKGQLIRKAENTFKQDLDIVSMASRLQEVEKLKFVLLDEDQLALFNYLSKPLIQVESEERSRLLTISQRKMSQLVERTKNAEIYLEGAYKNVLRRKDEKVCEKLIDLFEKVEIVKAIAKTAKGKKN